MLNCKKRRGLCPTVSFSKKYTIIDPSLGEKDGLGVPRNVVDLSSW